MTTVGDSHRNIVCTTNKVVTRTARVRTHVVGLDVISGVTLLRFALSLHSERAVYAWVVNPP